MLNTRATCFRVSDIGFYSVLPSLQYIYKLESDVQKLERVNTTPCIAGIQIINNGSNLERRVGYKYMYNYFH